MPRPRPVVTAWLFRTGLQHQMSSGLRESRRFATRQRRRRQIRILTVIAVLVGLGVFAYQSGKTLAERELRQAQEEVMRLMKRVAELERQNAEARGAVAVAQREKAEWEQRYRADIPAGERKALLALIDEQLKKGARPDRLRFLISVASQQEKCDGKPVTKRFIVRTPLHDGAAVSVNFAEDALTVMADGESAFDQQGRVLAWFDPAKPIKLKLVRLGGKTEELSGTLPLHHKTLINGAEYRLSAVAAKTQGFVNVTADRCRFP